MNKTAEEIRLMEERVKELEEALRKVEYESTYLDKGINKPGDLQISRIWTIANTALSNQPTSGAKERV